MPNLSVPLLCHSHLYTVFGGRSTLLEPGAPNLVALMSLQPNPDFDLLNPYTS